jgi:uncharacterized protein YjiS (DUF1127 family)
MEAPMATNDSHIHREIAPGLTALILHGIAWFVEAMARARQTALAYEHLATLSDKTLAEQGLTREDLPAAAYRRHFEG